jgi:hypothetical protein
MADRAEAERAAHDPAMGGARGGPTTAPAAKTTGGPQPAVPAASPAQAHQLAPTARRGRAKGETLGTTRRDLLLDPARSGGGEAMAVTTSAAGAPSADMVSSTLFYIQEAEADPMASEAELWTRATRRDLNYGGAVTTLQQPRRPAAPAAPSAGAYDPWAFAAGTTAVQDQLHSPNLAPKADKRALVIGNSDYPTASKFAPLQGAKRDAGLMARRYASRGYGVVERQNLKVNELRSAITGFASGLHRGVEGAIYFAGHGVDGDLTGMDSTIQGGKVQPVLPAATTSGAVGAALSAGAKLELVIDACDSGPMQDQVLADHGGKAQAQVTDEQGINTAVEARNGLHLSEEVSRTPIHLSDLSAAFGATYNKGLESAQAAAKDKAAKAGAAKAGGKPSGL